MIPLEQSLAEATAMIFHRYGGVVDDHGDHLCIRTPDNPTFWWGNYLLYGQAPRPGERVLWEAQFQQEIAKPQPASKHRVFAWLGEQGEIGEFLAAGYQPSAALQLSCHQPVLPAHANRKATVRPLQSEVEWQAAIEVQVACRDAEHDEAGYRQFKQRQFEQYRRMEQDGLGHRYGAFMGAQLVAELGIFRNEFGLGRYQNVATHPDWRRQGLASRLVYDAGQMAIAEFGLQQLVIIADEEGPQRMYQGVGFQPAGMAYAVEKAPPTE